MDFSGQALILCLLCTGLSTVSGQSIVGCPSYGCNPRGTFSLTVPIPLSFDVRIRWAVPIGGPLPKFAVQGCVVNHGQNIVVPVNTPSVVGYASFDVQTGNRTWADSVFLLPTLPIMDINGDIIGYDGNKMALVKANGQFVDPIIKFWPPLRPTFSLMLTDNGVMLMVSENGMILTYLTNGVIHASIFLTSTAKGVSGTYSPIAQPVIAGHRAYVLTRFVPHNASDNPKVKDVFPRLYAIDILRIMQPRMNVSWFMDMNPIPASKRKEDNPIRNTWSDAEFDMFSKKEESIAEEHLYHPKTPPRLLTTNGRVFVIMQDLNLSYWFIFFYMIDNGWNASCITIFGTKTANDFSADDLATQEHGYNIWLYSLKYGAIQRFNYMSNQLFTTNYLENIFTDCGHVFTSSLMIQTPLNNTDSYKFIVGMKLPQNQPNCKIHLPKHLSHASPKMGQHFLVTLNATLTLDVSYPDYYDPINVIYTEIAVRGQLATYYPDDSTSDPKPMIAAMGEDEHGQLLLNIQ